MVQWPKFVLFDCFLKAFLVSGRIGLIFYSSHEGLWLGPRCYCIPLHLIARGKEKCVSTTVSPLVGLAGLQLGCRLCGERSDM